MNEVTHKFCLFIIQIPIDGITNGCIEGRNYKSYMQNLLFLNKVIEINLVQDRPCPGATHTFPRIFPDPFLVPFLLVRAQSPFYPPP